MTAIEWTDEVWNPTTGCDRVSPGCDHCYALTMAKRLKAMGQEKYQTDGNPRTSGPGFGVAVHEDTRTAPLAWTRPRRVFVNSMSDLFHDQVSDEFIARVFATMAATPQHTYQILTKRHARMRSLLNSDDFRILAGTEYAALRMIAGLAPGQPLVINIWPLRNVWLGVSVENQHWADIRVPALLETPAAVRFLSCEPLLGPVDLTALRPHVCGRGPGGVCERWIHGLDWVIVGGESGAKARPMHPDWARSLRDQCAAADVPFFFKQHGVWAPLGPLYGDTDEVDDAHMEAVHLDVVERRSVVQLERDGSVADGHQPTDPRTWLMARVGKKAAGRELDGRTHDAFPRASSVSGLTESLSAYCRGTDAATDTARSA